MCFLIVLGSLAGQGRERKKLNQRQQFILCKRDYKDSRKPCSYCTPLPVLTPPWLGKKLARTAGSPHVSALAREWGDGTLWLSMESCFCSGTSCHCRCIQGDFIFPAITALFGFLRYWGVRERCSRKETGWPGSAIAGYAKWSLFLSLKIRVRTDIHASYRLNRSRDLARDLLGSKP